MISYCTFSLPSSFVSDTLTLSCLQSNTFQAVVTTDGFDSHAIFSYQCGLLNWKSTDGAVIGYSVDNKYYDNNIFSMSSNISNIACQQSPDSVWNSVLYNIGKSTVHYKIYIYILRSRQYRNIHNTCYSYERIPCFLSLTAVMKRYNEIIYVCMVQNEMLCINI